MNETCNLHLGNMELESLVWACESKNNLNHIMYMRRFDQQRIEMKNFHNEKILNQWSLLVYSAHIMGSSHVSFCLWFCCRREGTLLEIVPCSNWLGVPDGDIGDGDISDSGISDGGISDSDISDGGISDSDISDGGISDGGISDGDISDGGISDGDKIISDGGISDVLTVVLVMVVLVMVIPVSHWGNTRFHWVPSHSSSSDLSD